VCVHMPGEVDSSNTDYSALTAVATWKFNGNLWTILQL